MTTLGDLVVNGGIQTGPFGSQLHASDYTSDGVGVVMPQDLGDNVMVQDAMARVDPATAQALARHQLLPGDIVFSRRGDVTRRALVREGDGDLICGTGCLRVRLDRDVADPEFVSYALAIQATRDWLIRHAVGATMLNLNTGILSRLPLRSPTIHVQRAIGEMLGALDDKIAANRTVGSSSRALAEMMVTGVASSVKLGDLVRMVRKSIDPSLLDAGSVKHFSLPAFDAGAPGSETPASIKSAKNLLKEPVVLVSKLNPRIPRIWAVDRLPAEPALASTEFVALAPREVGLGALWAALLDPRFTQSVLERTGGTTGSHQRVKPEQMLDVEVRDVRKLTSEKRELTESLCRKVNDIADENQRLAATRDELLPLLMSGKITVKDAEKTIEEVV